ncbi:hypothetical protein M9458_017577, partial [Cirrhinus mrigala]
TAKNLSSSPESARTSSTAGCPQSTSDAPFGEPLAQESMSSNNLPQTEEPGLQPPTLSIPQSCSTQQFSKPQDQIYNAGPSLSPPLPEVLIHHCEHSETTKDEFEDSSKPDRSLHTQKEDFHIEMLAQVPFELGQPSLAGFPDMQQIQVEGMEKEDVEEKDDTLADVLEEPSRNIEEDKTGTCFHMLEVASQPPSSKEVNNATENAEKLNLSEEGFQEQKVELVSLVQVETTKMIEVESTKVDDEETDGLVASCLSHLGPTRQDKESQSLPIHPASDKLATVQHQQEEERLALDPSMMASILPEDPNLDNQTVSMCIPEHPPRKQAENPELINISETSPTAFELQPSTVNSSAEEDLTFEGDETSVAPYQRCKDPETQHTLPRPGTEVSQISKDHTKVTLYTCLIVSATFFTAVICLAVGIQEPSAFL